MTMSIGSGLEDPKRGEPETPLTVDGGNEIALVRFYIVMVNQEMSRYF